MNRSNQALFLSTAAFAANFSVWVLYSVTAFYIQDQLALTKTQLGILFAIPLLSGALIRLPFGYLSQTISPKRLMVATMIIASPGSYLLTYASEYMDYVLLGLWIGITGGSFTLGITYVNRWFERAQQGTALGIFGAGNAGAAVTLLITPWIIQHLGWQNVGPFFGCGLLLMALLFAWLAPSDSESPYHPRIQGSFQQAHVGKAKVLRNLQVWRFGLYYFFVFGSFLALTLWLPYYYHKVYQLSIEASLAFTLVFVGSSSLVRALGGWFSDRYGGRAVNWTVFWICIVCLFFLSYPPTTMTIHGVDRNVQVTIEINLWLFTGLIFIIGLAQGFGRAGVFKVINEYYPNDMATVGGFVGAIGALGGAILPVMFGIAEDWVGIHSVCFMILYGVLAACMITMFFALKADRFHQRLRHAQAYNFLEYD